ncbi:TlpA family protein disulfide reductase [uncultured Bradyrhizobium sp.]|uniref:thiol:disulfide interchange protein TlpA n=1 Tax=uncultured Bradyrhizobium sp. TaxID=199684 RepID=UPI0035C94467
MTNDMPDAFPPGRSIFRRIPIALGAISVGCAIGFAGVYGITGLKRAALADAPCASAVELSKKIAPLAKGEVAALAMATKPLQMPDLTFTDGNGQPKKLSDWKGRTVLLNLWATWCVPCRKEMPALDNLQGKLGGEKFAVVAVNIDTRNPEKPKAFLQDGNLTRLGYYTDSKAKVFQDLKSIGLALGMPTSVLIDGQGCEIGNIAGPAEWDSEDALKLINAATAG